MTASKRCGSTGLERSLCMMELIVADLRANHNWADTEISRIQAGVGQS